MRITSIFQLCLISLIAVGCRTPQAGDYFGRLPINACITLNEVGKMVCGGEVQDIPPGLIVPQTIEDYDYTRQYFEDKEFRLFKCLRYNRCE